MKWAGTLHQYFASKGYYFIHALYGTKWNGYMGGGGMCYCNYYIILYVCMYVCIYADSVGIAVPLRLYDILDVNITRIADTKK